MTPDVLALVVPRRVIVFWHGKTWLASLILLLVTGLSQLLTSHPAMIWPWLVLAAAAGTGYITTNLEATRHHNLQRLLLLNPHLAGLRARRWDERHLYEPLSDPHYFGPVRVMPGLPPATPALSRPILIA